MSNTPPSLADEVLKRVSDRTGGRVKGLAVDTAGGRVVIRGNTRSFHVKQLALHGALELVPPGGVVNAVVVEGEAAVA